MKGPRVTRETGAWPVRLTEWLGGLREAIPQLRGHRIQHRPGELKGLRLMDCFDCSMAPRAMRAPWAQPASRRLR